LTVSAFAYDAHWRSRKAETFRKYELPSKRLIACDCAQM
jgi:hypothetical protein